MVREFHDLTAGSDLAGDEEVVCHNDLSPKNTVYQEQDGVMLPVAFIDWDIAEPGVRIHDIAMVCWKYLDLGESVANIVTCARKMRLICDAYGMDDRSGLMDAIIWWQESTIWGIEYGADKGTEALIRLRDGGFTEAIRRNVAWVREHRAELERDL
jgi:aminoglycoside phosphotransferase (APT) family kinase protein